MIVSESDKFAEVEEMSFIEFLKIIPTPPPILLERGICVNVKLFGIKVEIGELICNQVSVRAIISGLNSSI